MKAHVESLAPKLWLSRLLRSELSAHAGLVLFKSAISAGVLARGFRALSDDDFARAVIAQRFAAAPALDPSGTSWLPASFWLHGSAMLLFGPHFEVAQVLGVLQGIAAILLVYTSARWLGLERAVAFVGASLASLLPESAWLGVAALPEALTAGLVVLGAAGFAIALRPGTERRVLVASVGLFLAAGSRYEAWPVAAAFSGQCLVQAARRRSPELVLASALAAAMPFAWLLHGVARHADALFFLERVASYERALGSGHSWLDRLLTYPTLLVRYEPELLILSIVGLALMKRHRTSFVEWRFPVRFWLPLAAIFVFLVMGELRGGAPTHHKERVLLPIWYGLCLVSASLWAQIRVRRYLAPLAVGGALLSFSIRLARTDFRSFGSREHELAIGSIAAELVPQGERVVIDTADFGYFAIMAGFERPCDAAPFDDRDPRRPRLDAFGSSASLAASLKALCTGSAPTLMSCDAAEERGQPRSARWFIATERHARVADSVARVRRSVPGFSLYEVLSSPMHPSHQHL